MSESRIRVNEVVVDKALKSVINAYSGEPFELRMVGAGDHAYSYLSPSAVSPLRWHEDPAKLLRTASTRRGVLNAVPPEEAFVCPYTGKRMQMESGELGCRMVGGFDPAFPRDSVAEFLHLASMRKGIANPSFRKPKAKKPVVKLVGVVEPQERLPYVRNKPGDAQQEAADRVVHSLKKAVNR